MRRYLNNILLFMVSLCLWACEGRDLLPERPADMNTPIVLSMGGKDNVSESPRTRTITDNLSPGASYSNLPDGTHLFMYMQSDYDTQDGAVSFAGGTATKYCKTRGVINTTTSPNIIQFVDETSKTRTRYWEDAHARCSRLSIYAVGAPGMSYIRGGENASSSGAALSAITEPNTPWSTTAFVRTDIEDIEWNVPNGNLSPNYQAEVYIKNRDLIYSNNISDQHSNTELAEELRTDRRLKFNTSSKTFEHGTLTFYHALSKITVKIKKGDGFGLTEPFAFTEVDGAKNIKLNKFNIWGKFNAKQGRFTTLNSPAHASIMGMWVNPDKPEGITYQLEALVLPYSGETNVDKKTRKGSLFSSAESSASDYLMEFYIDNNKYQITSAQLFNAIKNVGANNIANDAVEIHLESGKNYEFTILVDKSKIAGIEAKIIPWETVTATAQASNTHVTLSLKDTEGAAVTGGGFSLYRAAGAEYSGSDYNSYAVYDWEKGYEGPAANVTESDSIYDAEWYWPNNKTFYHFRTLKPSGQTLNNNTGDGAVTSVAISGGTLIQVGETPASSVDYQWGAPFKSGASLGYSHTSGFCNNADKASGQLYKAIGATDGVIAITQLHMTSQVFVDLETSAGSDRVDLTGASVTLTNLATSANLQLGNGLVTGHGAYSNVPITADAHAAADGVPAYDYSYGVLPQKLSGNGNTTGVGNANGTVGIIISLTDGNRYIIENLGTVKANNTAVTTWDPGKKYYYRFKLTKSGIDPIYATIKDWEDVSANYGDIKIE